MSALLEDPPRFLLLTGKGGVGKTSLACASAVELARRGRRVLLVSTDPASNVAQVFGQEIGNTLTPIRGVEGLSALEIDPDAAAEEYRARAIAPLKDFLSAADLAEVTEQLSGSCTTEIASFNEFTGLLADRDAGGGVDHIVFDTAPTGHTVRLLELPGEWTSFLEDGLGDASCLGPMAGLDRTRATYGEALSALADPGRTRLALVARPQTSSLAEAARTARELTEAGIRPTHLVINAIMGPEAVTDPLADAIRAEEHEAMEHLPRELAGLRQDRVALRPLDVVGLPALRAVLGGTPEMTGTVGVTAHREEGPAPDAAGESAGEFLGDLVEALARHDHGLVMLMGKGGVGKTTLAAAIAVGLADRGRDVLLTTTDPAAHLAWTLGGEAPMEVSGIDPHRAVADYRRRAMETRGAGLDEQGRANLAEDLRSPCTEEVAVFEAFAAAVEQSSRRFVVMDTAPTGHTLLLMDATGAHDREVRRTLAGSGAVTPLERLRDAGNTHVVVVTLPETTPVLEAEGLAADLGRAGVGVWGWVVNRSLSVVETASPLLRRRAAAERGPMTAVRSHVDEGGAAHLALVGYRATPPVGVAELRAMAAIDARVR